MTLDEQKLRSGCSICLPTLGERALTAVTITLRVVEVLAKLLTLELLNVGYCQKRKFESIRMHGDSLMGL